MFQLRHTTLRMITLSIAFLSMGAANASMLESSIYTEGEYAIAPNLSKASDVSNDCDEELGVGVEDDVLNLNMRSIPIKSGTLTIPSEGDRGCEDGWTLVRVDKPTTTTLTMDNFRKCNGAFQSRYIRTVTIEKNKITEKVERKVVKGVTLANDPKLNICVYTLKRENGQKDNRD